MTCRRLLRQAPERLNVDGEALALGHPFGMTGPRMVSRLLGCLRRSGGRTGLVTTPTAAATGWGMAVVLDRSPGG